MIDLGLGQIRIGRLGNGGAYGPAEGSLKLREAIAAYEGEPVEAIRVTTGASAGLLSALATVPAGAGVLCPRPYFQGYPHLIGRLGLQACYYDLTPECGWSPDPDCLLRAATDETRVLLLNYPANPSGSIPPEAAIRDIAALASAKGWLVLLDEVYRPFVYGGARIQSMRGLVPDEKLVRVHSFSKAFQIPGERVGYTISSEAMARKISQAHWRLLMSPPVSSQAVALRALRDAGNRLSRLRETLASNRTLACGILASCPRLVYQEPAGGLFFWIGVPGCELPSKAIARFCEEAAGVCVVPGNLCGWSREPYLRVSFAASAADVRIGFTNLVAALGACFEVS